MVLVVMMSWLVGCTSTSKFDQGQANAIAQTAGAGCVLALNAKGDKLKPQEKQAALAAVAAFSMMGTADMTKGLQPQVDALIDSKIKDPTEAQAAKTMSASFLAMIAPQITDAANKAGTSAAGQVFLSFCKGLSSVPLK